MRPVLFLILAIVAITLGSVMKFGSYSNLYVYLLSMLATAGCGYLIADNFFRNAKKKFHAQHESHKNHISELNNEIDILKTQIKNMPPHSEIEALHNNLISSMADNDKLSQEVKGKNSIIAQKNNDIAGLRDSLNQLRITHETVRNNLVEKDALIAKHEDTLTQLQPVIAAMHDEHDKLQETLAAKDALIAKHEDTLTQLQPVIAAMHDEHDKLQDTLAAKDVVIAKQGATLTQLQPVIAAMHDEHDKLQSTLAAKDAVIAKQEDTLTQLHPVITALHDEHDILQRSITEKDAETQQLQNEIGATNATLSEYRTAIKELHGIIAAKEKNEDQLEKNLISRDTEISGLKTNLTTVQAERDVAKEALALKDAALVQYQNTIIALNDAADKTKQVQGQITAQHQAELVQVRQVLEDTRSKMTNLAGDNEKIRAKPAVAAASNGKAEPESTQFLSIDKSIGIIRSHRTRSVDDDVDGNKTIPETPAPVTVENHIEIVTPSVVIIQPEPAHETKVTVNESVNILPSDDLKIIEGIGPKIELVLNAASINTWHQLAHTEPEKLREILSDAGKRFNANDPSTWPEQARLLANGETEKFKAYTDFLISGRIPKA